MIEYSAIIEITSTGYSGYVQEMPGVASAASDMSSLKADLNEAIQMGQGNELPFHITYLVDLQQFFEHFKVLNKSALAAYLGINPSLFRQYTSGLTPLSDAKLQTITKGLQRLSHELNNVSFTSTSI